MRAPIAFFLALTALSAGAQPAIQTPLRPAEDVASPPSSASEGRKNQRVQRIRLEDSGSQIDEVRYGGQTQSITVKPKANLPEYEFQPTDLARSRPADQRAGLSSATAQRVWNVLKF